MNLNGTVVLPTVHNVTDEQEIKTFLQSIKEEHVELGSAADLFLLPGPVDQDVECVLGSVPTKFMRSEISRHFSCLLLSAYAFGMREGRAYFHFTKELELQTGCALLSARDKFLFLDPSKFREEGEPAYTVRELFENTEYVTIYTVSSSLDSRIVEDFEYLASSLGMEEKIEKPISGLKSVRLCIIESSGGLGANLVRWGSPARDECAGE